MGVGTCNSVASKVSGTGADFHTERATVTTCHRVATGVLLMPSLAPEPLSTQSPEEGEPEAIMSYCVSVPAREYEITGRAVLVICETVSAIDLRKGYFGVDVSTTVHRAGECGVQSTTGVVARPA